MTTNAPNDELNRIFRGQVADQQQRRRERAGRLFGIAPPDQHDDQTDQQDRIEQQQPDEGEGEAK